MQSLTRMNWKPPTRWQLSIQHQVIINRRSVYVLNSLFYMMCKFFFSFFTLRTIWSKQQYYMYKQRLSARLCVDVNCGYELCFQVGRNMMTYCLWLHISAIHKLSSGFNVLHYIRFTMDVVFWFLIRYDYFFLLFRKMRSYLIQRLYFRRGLLQLNLCAELYITMQENNRRKTELQPRGSLLQNTKYY